MHPLDDLLRLVGFLIGAIPIGFAPHGGPSTRCRKTADRRGAKPRRKTRIDAKLSRALLHHLVELVKTEGSHRGRVADEDRAAVPGAVRPAQ